MSFPQRGPFSPEADAMPERRPNSVLASGQSEKNVPLRKSLKEELRDDVSEDTVGGAEPINVYLTNMLCNLERGSQPP